MITLVDFCPACKEVVAAALLRLQTRRGDVGVDVSRPGHVQAERSGAGLEAVVPMLWPKERHGTLEPPLATANSLALPTERSARATAVLARAVGYAVVAVGLVTLATWLIAR